jgi:transposase
MAIGVDLSVLARLAPGTTPESATLQAAGLRHTEDDDIYHVDQGVIRPPLGMKRLEKHGLRVVPYFRPSLFLRNRDSLERLCLNVEGKVAALNIELANARRSRTEESVRKKVDQLLQHFKVTEEFSVRLEAIELAAKMKATTKTPKLIRSFRVHLDRVGSASPRKLNAGWMVLLAHPNDDRPALVLIRQYHQKEIVEHGFAIIKSFVELRPIRHHRDLKIKAHVTLCVLALVLSRYLELKLRDAGIHDAVDRIYEQLEPCRLHLLSDRSGKLKRLIITQPRPQQLRLLEPIGLSHLVEQETVRPLVRVV